MAITNPLPAINYTAVTKSLPWYNPSQTTQISSTPSSPVYQVLTSGLIGPVTTSVSSSSTTPTPTTPNYEMVLIVGAIIVVIIILAML